MMNKLKLAPVIKMSLLGMGVAGLWYLVAEKDITSGFSTKSDIDTLKVLSIEQQGRMHTNVVVGYNMSTNNPVVGTTTGSHVKTNMHLISKDGKDVVLDYVPECVADSVVAPSVGDEVVLQRDKYYLGKIRYWNKNKIIDNFTQKKIRQEYLNLHR